DDPRRAPVRDAESDREALVQCPRPGKVGERRIGEKRQVHVRSGTLDLPLVARMQAAAAARPGLHALAPAPARAADAQRHAVARDLALARVEVEGIHDVGHGSCIRERGRFAHALHVGGVERELELDFHGYSSVRARQSSGKRTTSSSRRRYATPEVPPVPRLNPITRSTVVAWRKRHWRNASSRSTSFSASSYKSQCWAVLRYTSTQARHTDSLNAWRAPQSRSTHAASMAKPRRASTRMASS